MPRKFDSEIKIDEAGKWYYKGSEIIQENVLSFFKKSLREDEIGLYIENIYAELIEHGYIETKNFPLLIKDHILIHDEVFFELENSIRTRIDEFNFYSDENGRLFCILKKAKFLKYGFSNDLLQFLSKYLEESGEDYYLNVGGLKIEVKKFKEKLNVDIPPF